MNSTIDSLTLLAKNGWPEAAKQWQSERDMLAAVIALARSHADPRSNPGAHRLAVEILKMCGEWESNDREAISRQA